MQLTIQLFANLRDLFSSNTLVLDAPDGLTASELLEEIVRQYPKATGHVENVFVARNQTMARPTEVLLQNDEIALIPPVGGGETDEVSSPCLWISDQPLDVQSAYQLLEDANCGGTVFFIGTVREWTGDKQTRYLEYEAYLSMAYRQMEQIAAEVEAEFPLTKTLQWHRVGHLQPTDIAVICGAASPHRKNAFLAANMLIERLKKEVAIWKKEVFADGTTTWQPNPK